MAVNINTVYQRVLTIANKEQRGYITPQEFNILANQAQMDLFEQYFYDTNQFSRVPGNNTGHSDMLTTLDEKISFFKKVSGMLASNEELTQSTFESGSISGWTDSTGNNTAPSIVSNANNGYVNSIKLINDGSDADPNITTTATLSTSSTYKLTVDVSYANDPDGVGDDVLVALTARSSSSSTDGYHILRVPVVTGGTYTLDFTPLDVAGGSASTEAMTIDIVLDESGSDSSEVHFSKISVQKIDNTTLPTDLYKIETVVRRDGSDSSQYYRLSQFTEVEARLRNQTPLGKPTIKRPIFYRDSATTVQLLPASGYHANDRIQVHYIKKPATVAWGYIVTSGTSVYNSSTSTNFELHESEEVNLVNRILVLSGIMIKDPTLTQIMSQEEVNDIQQEKI